MLQSRRKHARGFTLLELLVVISLIAVLTAILLPSVSKLRSMALGVKCQGNVRTLTAACLAFAADHDARLPGCNYNSTPAYESDWLMGLPYTYNSAPQAGTLWPYVNSASVYLCPAMDSERDTGGTGDDEYASNGRFDYGFWVIFNGAPIRAVPAQSQLTQLNGTTSWYPTPIMCQEEGLRINGTNQEGDHSNVDQMTHIHNGGGYYGSIDGSVTWVIEPDVINGYSNGCHQWAAMGPGSKALHNLGGINNGGSYGTWGSWMEQ